MATGKYQVNVSFSLETRLEPEGVNFNRYASSDIEDYDDSSSFYEENVEASGGAITFVVEAEDEDAARSKAEDFIFDGMEVEDNMGLTWQVSNFDMEIEAIEEPMDDEKAKEILAALISSFVVSDEQKAALQYLLEKLLP